MTVGGSVEEYLEKAVRYTLLTLSQPSRSIILVLRSLSENNKTREDLLLECEALRVNCKGLDNAIKYLVSLGLVEERNGTLSLTSEGKDLAASIRDIEIELADLARIVLEKNASEFDVYAHVFTGIASVIGAVEGHVLGLPLRLALTIHGYLSILSTTMLALLAKSNRELVEMLNKMLEVEGDNT